MDLVFAASTCTAFTEQGDPVNLIKGDAWASDDPFVARHADLFSKEPTLVRRTVIETTTAAPGEMRHRG